MTIIKIRIRKTVTPSIVSSVRVECRARPEAVSQTIALIGIANQIKLALCIQPRSSNRLATKYPEAAAEPGVKTKYISISAQPEKKPERGPMDAPTNP